MEADDSLWRPLKGTAKRKRRIVFSIIKRVLETFSLKRLQKVEKSLYAQGNTKNQYQMATIFDAFCGTLLRIGMIQSWRALHGLPDCLSCIPKCKVNLYHTEHYSSSSAVSIINQEHLINVTALHCSFLCCAPLPPFSSFLYMFAGQSFQIYILTCSSTL